MEPGLGGQEKAPQRVWGANVREVAMEPGLGGQEKCRWAAVHHGVSKSQWSLALAARKSMKCGWWRYSDAYEGRNGAWPWRPGKATQSPAPAHAANEVAMEPGLGGQEKRVIRATHPRTNVSQWSLALAARKSRNLPAKSLGGDQVAMEPGLGGQEKRRPRNSRSHCIIVAMEPGLGGQEKLADGSAIVSFLFGRNGAWPWRPGKEHFSGHMRSLSDCRNGAWPWRPGKAPTDETTRGEEIWSQWSLALAARKSRPRR